MVDGAEVLFRRIADAMAGAVPEDWAEAGFFALFYPDGSVYEAEYKRLVDGVACGFQPSDDGSRATRALRRAFKAAGKPLWGRLWFTLRPDGRFDVRLGYEGCDADGNAIFDAEAEYQRQQQRVQRLNGR